jgi:hypothetical protein
MTIKEELRRIIKAAPHLPIQALLSIAILVILIPTLLIQMGDSVFTRWVETEGVISANRGVQDRIKNGRTEYFFSIDYEFIVNNHRYVAPYEKGYSERSSAERDLQAILIESKPITLWYDRANPKNSTFDQHKMLWPGYLAVLVMLILLLLYFRWLMLKYYELELSD